MKKTIIRAGLETLYFSGAYQMMRPFVAGVGAILTLHHVRPPRPDRFQPNRLLEVTPRFLERCCVDLRRRELDLVSLDEMHRRLVEGDFDAASSASRSMTAIATRCNGPIRSSTLSRRRSRVYIPTSFPDRLGELWWLALEAVVARNEAHQCCCLDGQEADASMCARVAEKRDAVRPALWLGAQPAKRRRAAQRRARSQRPAIRSTLRRFATSCA